MSNNEMIPDRDAASYENPLYIEAAKTDVSLRVILRHVEAADTARKSEVGNPYAIARFYELEDIAREIAHEAGYYQK